MPEGPTSVARFTVTLPKVARGKIRVPYRTVDGTAKAGADYTARRGRLVFKRGQRKKTISVPITDDALDEAHETFRLRVSAVKKRLKAKSALATIVDDDAPPGTGGGGTTTTTTTGGDGGGSTGGGGTTTPAETCNGADEDADGAVDDGVCTVTVTITGTGSGTVASSPAGISCPSVCSASFPQGATLTATPDAGSGIVWGGACSGGQASCTLAAGEHAVTAEFTNAPIVGALRLNEILADPGATGDANGDGTPSVVDDEFVEIYNGTTAGINLNGYEIHDAVQLRHTFGSGVLAPGCAVVVFGGGTPTGSFGGAATTIASTGSLGIGTSDEQVTLAGPGGAIIADQHSWGTNGADGDQSLTRSPDVTGSFVLHQSAPGSVGPFSPGTTLDGTPFDGC